MREHYIHSISTTNPSLTVNNKTKKTFRQTTDTRTDKQDWPTQYIQTNSRHKDR